MMVETGASLETKIIEGNTLMNRSVWDDDKCRMVWKHLVTNLPYDWPWKRNTESKFLEITGCTADVMKSCSGSDLASARKLRTLIREILTSDDEQKATETAVWIVALWGGIGAGKDTIPSWMNELRPFDGISVSNFIRKLQTERISSWSKILSFFDCERHAVYDSRTAVALNAALVLSDLRPRFHMPLSRIDIRKDWVSIIKSRSENLTAGYYEYIFLLERFTELGLAESVLDAERRIFAGSNKTAESMMEKLGTH
jgi:hypothetical protein